MNELKRALSVVTYQLYANALLCSMLLALSASVLTATFVHAPVWVALAGLVGFGAGVLLRKLFEDKKPRAIRLIHRTIGEVEYSLPLLTKPRPNLAEQLQLERLGERVRNVRVPGVLWSKIGLYGSILLAAITVHFAYPLLQINLKTPEKKGFFSALVPKRKAAAPTFQSAELRIQPPNYTRLPTVNSADLNASALVGSVLTWRLRFSDSANLSVRLVNGRGQEIAFRRSGSAFTHQDKLLRSGLYAIKAVWHRDTGRDSVVYQSDYYRLEAKPDLAPRIEPISKELHQFHHLKDSKILNIAARISDDFGVSRVFIVATVARGSGENVKFRAVRMPLGPTDFRDARLTKAIDLNALKFAPGDELYYYWAAFDNRQPEPNFTKSDTYFVVYKDTARLDESELATMAVNIMPEYFRSQRQIIIDTEKLLANQKKMASTAFKSQSNEIGFDQKALRLRYGQFLGEEFENSIGGGNALPDDHDGDPLAGFVHDHDKGEGDHNAPVREDAHEHDHGNSGNDAPKDPVAALMEQYVHQHDDAETNTFYEQSTRSLLKMSLENMWQSELHLRLYEPEKALPFERKALEYLKLSQQKARSYVKKTGFDPPPTNEKETRLTGELKNVNRTFRQQRSHTHPHVEPLVAEVLGYLELPQLDARQRQTVGQLGNALAKRIVNSGLPNWSVLTSLQKMAGGNRLSNAEKRRLKTKLYALAPTSEQTGASYTADRALQRSFWQHLK